MQHQCVKGETIKAVILDRDGTINDDRGYICSIAGFEYLGGAPDGLKLLQDYGYTLIIITNQSGIARGFFSEKDYQDLTRWMIEDLANRGIEIAATYYCPHHPEGIIESYREDCDCRKPKTGLFEKAIKDFALDLTNLYVIGDRERDVALCNKYNSVRGVVLYSDQRKTIGNVHYIESGLLEAAKLIVGTENEKLDTANH